MWKQVQSENTISIWFSGRASKSRDRGHVRPCSAYSDFSENSISVCVHQQTFQTTCFSVFVIKELRIQNFIKSFKNLLDCQLFRLNPSTLISLHYYSDWLHSSLMTGERLCDKSMASKVPTLFTVWRRACDPDHNILPGLSVLSSVN